MWTPWTFFEIWVYMSAQTVFGRLRYPLSAKRLLRSDASAGWGEVQPVLVPHPHMLVPTPRRPFLGSTDRWALRRPLVAFASRYLITKRLQQTDVFFGLGEVHPEPSPVTDGGFNPLVDFHRDLQLDERSDGLWPPSLPAIYILWNAAILLVSYAGSLQHS